MSNFMNIPEIYKKKLEHAMINNLEYAKLEKRRKKQVWVIFKHFSNYKTVGHSIKNNTFLLAVFSKQFHYY